MQYLFDAASVGGLYALMALGIALIFGVMGLVNFAHGELVMIGAYSILLLSGAMPWMLVVLSALVIVVVAALGMERIYRPLRGANPATLLAASFGLSFLLQNLVILVFGSSPRTARLPSFLGAEFTIAGIRLEMLQVLSTGLTILLLIALALFLKRTSLGIQMRAAAEDFELARMRGIPANRVIASAFAISGLLAAIVSLILMGQLGLASPTIGLRPVLVAFVATVIGGLGSLTGAVIGGFLFGAVTVVLQAFLPLELRSFRDAFAFGLVILLLLLRPRGILGKTHVRV